MKVRSLHHRNQTLHGFTLLELVIVMAVLAVLAAVMVPSLRGFLTASLARDASTQVISLTQYARAKAAAESTIYRLNIDSLNGEYWLTMQDGGAFTELGNEFGDHFTLPPRMRIELTPITTASDSNAPVSGDSINFRPDGSSDTFVIRMIDGDGMTQTIAAPSSGEAYRLMNEEEVARL